MSEKTSYYKINIDFYFAPDETNRESRLAQARALLVSKQALDIQQITESVGNNLTERVTLIAFVPIAQAMLHHGFDSVLNREVARGGCGAGYVGDDGKEYIF